MVLYVLDLIDPSNTISSGSNSSRSTPLLGNNPTNHPADLDIGPDVTIAAVFVDLCKDTFANLFGNSETPRGLQ
jgi:hypothetical protein